MDKKAGFGVNELKWYSYLPVIVLTVAMLFTDVISVFGWNSLSVGYQLQPVMVSLGMHITTIAIWCGSSALILILAKRKLQVDIFLDAATPSVGGIVICILLAALQTAVMYMAWGGFKPQLELYSSIRRFGDWGMLDFAVQCIYYALEMLLAFLIVAFGQKAGEALTKLDKVPWGGILLAVIWGMPHMFTKGSLAVGIISLGLGLVMGLPYIFLKRNARITWFFMFIMFLL